MSAESVLAGMVIFCGSLAVGHAEEEPRELAARAKQILKASCYRCHGESGTVEGGVNYLLNREQLVARRRIVPGDAAKSRLMKRILDGEMPPEDEVPRLSEQDIAVLKRWIDAGAPEFDPPVAKRELLTPTLVLERIAADLDRLPERDRRFTRYFSLAPLYNARLATDELSTYRQALAKLVNSLSWGRSIVVPAAIDAEGVILRVDLRDFRWTDKTWDMILQRYPYALLTNTQAERQCQNATQTQIPCVRADWFVADAAHPPLYHGILQIPLSDLELEKELRVDVAENLRSERVLRAGFNSSGVSRNNRLIERHETAFGAYWKSYDFGGNSGRQNLFAFPLGPGRFTNAFQHDGGELIFNLPNGLQAYMLVDARGQRIDKGPTEIVSDPRRPDRAVVNGLSCMSCHARGILPKEDQVRAHVEKNQQGFSRSELDTILALYAPREKLNAAMAEDAERFRRAVERCGARFGGAEPIVALALRFEAELDLDIAAGEVGLNGADLLKKLESLPALARVLGPLGVPGGTVQRQTFTDSFADLVRGLSLGVVLLRQQSNSPTGTWASPSLLQPPLKVAVIRNPRIDPPRFEPPRKFEPLPGKIVAEGRLFKFPNHQGAGSRQVAFSPIENLLASESNNGTVSLWDPATGKERLQLLGDGAQVASLDFSPDGKLLATGVLKVVKVWDVATGKTVLTLPGHTTFVMAVRFSPDNRSLATGNDKVRLWDLATGQEKVVFPAKLEWVDGLAFSPDSKLLASAGKVVRLWDTATGNEVAVLHGHQDKQGVLTVAFSPDGTLLASGSSDRTIRFWDVASRTTVKVLKGHRDPLSAVAFTPDGKLLVSVAGAIRYNPGDLGEVKVWDVASGAELASLSGHTKGVAGVTISADGRFAASTARDRTVRLWELTREKLQQSSELRP